jgi:hypothetical protein
MCYHTDIYRQGAAMRLLRIAVEKRRWDLAAHTIILATASVVKNGDKPPASKGVSNNPSLSISGSADAGKITKTRGREFERKKRGSNR